MAQIASVAARAANSVLESGIPLAVAQIAAVENIPPGQLPVPKITEQNISADTLEKRIGAQYPSVSIFCEKLDNRLTEKFRTFSGIAKIAAEVRVSQDNIINLENQIRLYIDAVTSVLDVNRGNWNNGIFYVGGYEVTFSPIKHGGKNYLQSARVSFSLDVSVD